MKTGSFERRADELLAEQFERVRRGTDSMFAKLMALQYAAALLIALLITPLTWQGAMSAVHVHLWAAGLLGLIVAAFPVYLSRVRPGAAITRHAFAAAQMLYSALFIHLTGGRIETHFHVFGGLAFLAFYRDPKVLVTASLVVAADHIVRGFVWPQSVFGVDWAPWWRAFEHAGWVLFEDIFLAFSIARARDEMRGMAERQASLEGIIPICSYCRRLRDDQEAYHQMEAYFRRHTNLVFSHGICPDCLHKEFPEDAAELKEEGR